jgi:hypothetical protein
VIRTRRHRSPGLILLALAVSITAEGAAVVGYEVTRPIPNPTLTIHLDDAASSWDYEITAQPANATSVKVEGPKGFKVAHDLIKTSGTLEHHLGISIEVLARYFSMSAVIGQDRYCETLVFSRELIVTDDKVPVCCCVFGEYRDNTYTARNVCKRRLQLLNALKGILDITH